MATKAAAMPSSAAPDAPRDAPRDARRDVPSGARRDVPSDVRPAVRRDVQSVAVDGRNQDGNWDAARSLDRAAFLWAIFLCSASSLALSETNQAATFLAAIATPLLPAHISPAARALLLACAIAVYFLGAGTLVIVAPLGLAVVGQVRSVPVAAMALLAIAFLSPYFQTLPPNLLWSSLHPGSSSFLLIPSLAAAAIAARQLPWQRLLAMIGLSLAMVVALAAAIKGGWIAAPQLSDPLLRLFLGLLPVLSLINGRPCPKDTVDRGTLGVWIAAAAAGAIAVAFIPSRPINSVVFDESHGKWETTLGHFGPAEFGRAANYNYALLSDYAERLVGDSEAYLNEDRPLPGTDSVFVIKMPTQPLGPDFAARLEAWVKAGGRLIVIADHTDLYDNAQNVNRVLSDFGYQINSDAVFDRRGLPNVPDAARSLAFFGRLDADGEPLAWQTGASLASMPMAAVTLATYGPSFSEPGDYSRPNRFGSFNPDPRLRYAEHTAVAASAVGNGAIAVVLDSTPWSTFSFFKDGYKSLFRRLIRALEMPNALWIAGWGALSLPLLLIGCILADARSVFVAAGLAVGLTVGAHAKLGVGAYDTPLEGRDFDLRVATGHLAKLEFLRQLVLPGERNFSRIVSSTAKYRFMASALAEGAHVPPVGSARKWLFIEPDLSQLPETAAIYDHLRRGSDVTILFAPEAARAPEIRSWLSDLGLNLTRSNGLGVTEDRRSVQDGLLARQGPALIRDVRTATVAVPSSLLKEHGGNALTQTYTIRPTTFPRTSGLLNIGFSSDQFSDDAIGDVWEGIQPSSLGKLRERQLAAALLGQEPPTPYPADLLSPTSRSNQAGLSSFVVLRDGDIVLTGDLPPAVGAVSATPLSPSEHTLGYLTDLRDAAAAFISSSCPKARRVTTCDARFLAPDMIEWMVSWTAADGGEISAIELLHERRFSGLENTWNVLFSR